MKKKITELQKGGTRLNVQHMHNESATGEERERNRNISEEIMAENIPNLMNNTNLHL